MRFACFQGARYFNCWSWKLLFKYNFRYNLVISWVLVLFGVFKRHKPFGTVFVVVLTVVSTCFGHKNSLAKHDHEGSCRFQGVVERLVPKLSVSALVWSAWFASWLASFVCCCLLLSPLPLVWTCFLGLPFHSWCSCLPSYFGLLWLRFYFLSAFVTFLLSVCFGYVSTFCLLLLPFHFLPASVTFLLSVCFCYLSTFCLLLLLFYFLTAPVTFLLSACFCYLATFCLLLLPSYLWSASSGFETLPVPFSLTYLFAVNLLSKVVSELPQVVCFDFVFPKKTGEFLLMAGLSNAFTLREVYYHFVL